MASVRMVASIQRIGPPRRRNARHLCAKQRLLVNPCWRRRESTEPFSATRERRHRQQ
jgi:hypothetical protein